LAPGTAKNNLSRVVEIIGLMGIGRIRIPVHGDKPVVGC
jgi:hypothetical protein